MAVKGRQYRVTGRFGSELFDEFVDAQDAWQLECEEVEEHGSTAVWEVLQDGVVVKKYEATRQMSGPEAVVTRKV